MKRRTAFGIAVFSILPSMAWPQEAVIKIDLAPLLAKFEETNWAYVIHEKDTNIPDAVRAAFAKPPFQPAPGPGADVLTLMAPEAVKKANDQYQFIVVFRRNGKKLGEAVESCPTEKVADCIDQLVLDAETAAK